MEPADLLDLIEHEARKSCATLDGLLYNGGVVFTLICTGTATIGGAFNAAGTTIPVWWAPLLSGLATIWVGIDRALQFGPRWLNQRALNARCASLRYRITTLSMLPKEKQQTELEEIRKAIVELPLHGVAVPGMEGPKDPRRERSGT